MEVLEASSHTVEKPSTATEYEHEIRVLEYRATSWAQLEYVTIYLSRTKLLITWIFR